MIDKTYTIEIQSSKENVWEIMLGKETYPQWIKGFSENSDMIGEWEQGTEVDFIDINHGGTRAILEVVEKPTRLVAKHIAVLDKEGNVASGGETWIGTVEEYQLTEKDGKTTLKIFMHYHPDFQEMLDKGWTVSLKLLKEMCEK